MLQQCYRKTRPYSLVRILEFLINKINCASLANQVPGASQQDVLEFVTSWYLLAFPAWIWQFPTLYFKLCQSPIQLLETQATYDCYSFFVASQRCILDNMLGPVIRTKCTHFLHLSSQGHQC